MLSSNVAEAYGFVRTAVADRTDAPADLPDIEIIFATAPYVGEGLVPPPAGHHGGRDPAQPRSRGTIRLASSDPTDAAIIDPAYRRPAGIDAETLRAGLAGASASSRPRHCAP